MLKLKVLEELGKPYKIFTEVLEGGAIEQFVNCMKQPDVVQGALMPDAHTGYVLPIGGVVATKGTIYPAFVGYDIGCGVSTVLLPISKAAIAADPKTFREAIEGTVPVGFNVHHHAYDKATLERRIGKCPKQIEDLFEQTLNQVATLGGGNHFIEIGANEHDSVYLTIHSGSRGFGHRVATRYMKASGGEGCFPLDVNSDLGKEYIEAMEYCLRWALFNREKMMRNICDALGFVFKEATMINRNHNHAEEKDGLWVHRKGATHAESGMYGVIPANMRDGVFIVRGKGSADSLCSSSHGAGRVLSRSKAKKTISLEDFKEMMTGMDLDGFTVDEGHIDESPKAYKDIFEVMKNQEDLVKVCAHIKPMINVKG